MKIAIGSDNPVKIKATEKAFSDRLDVDFEFEHKKMPSGVPDQPFDDEIQIGAHNRAVAVQREFNADYGVGLEGGTTKHQGQYFEYGWCAIVDRSGKVTYGHSFGVPIPEVLVTKIVDEKKELGISLDELLHKDNTKQKDGFFGFATGNCITRESAYYAMVCAALAPIVLKEYYG
ncbi:MAG: inosine/xanthosine triphosphatase [Patescibacteria group bacterium]|jgi:inosine/xanthosine triphosphatase